MARIFISHSSVDERETVALTQWLADQGWDDVFLDLDPTRGIAAGQRWQDALRKAADQCEAVLLVVSPAWVKSDWCRTEFKVAQMLSKRIFVVALKEVPIGTLPSELTSEWQICWLAGDGPRDTVRFVDRGTAGEVEFLTDGLKRLREGLERAGLSADFFAWPPKDDPQRAPYRGMEPLDVADAAVFFGREVEILRGLNALRGMRETGDQNLFIILGASGAGKSSFLRAGLWPRLARDERHFQPLPVIRPGRAPITGEQGLVCALHLARSQVGLPPVNLADVKARVAGGADALAAMLREIQDAARMHLVSSESRETSAPTLLLAIDQAEELFNATADPEARTLLRLLGEVLGAGNTQSTSPQRPLLILVCTIRSDRFEPLQTAPELAALKSVVFDDIKPMPADRFREVIVGPAKCATEHGTRLTVRPELVDQLVSECAQGGDILPLLGLTLARLYRDYGSDGDLRLEEYRDCGGLKNIVKLEMESVLASEATRRAEQLALLRSLFIPWLVKIDTKSDQPVRRVASRSDLPKACDELIEALVVKRLLLTDRRGDFNVIEVAHESLLRNWDVLGAWIAEERRGLRIREDVEGCADKWLASDRSADNLDHRGVRLADAEGLLSQESYRQSLSSTASDYLVACRQREMEELTRETQRLERERAQAVRAASRQRKLALVAGGVAVVALALAVYVKRQLNENVRLQEAAEITEEISYISAGRLALKSASEPLEETAYRALAAYRLAGQGLAHGTDSSLIALHDFLESYSHLRKTVTAEGLAPTPALAYSPDGERLAIGGNDGFIHLLDAESYQERGRLDCRNSSESVWSLAYAADGRHLVGGFAGTSGHEGTGVICDFDLESGQARRLEAAGMTGDIYSVAYGHAPDGDFVVAGGSDKVLRIWNAEGKLVSSYTNSSAVAGIAVNRTGGTIAWGSEDGTVRAWRGRAESPDPTPMEVGRHGATVQYVVFTPNSDSTLVSVADDGRIKVWNVDAPCLAQQSPEQPARLYGVAVNGDGSMLATAGADGNIRLFWLSESSCVAQDAAKDPANVPSLTDVDEGVLTGHANLVLAVAFDLERDVLASTGEDGSIRIWRPVTGGMSLAQLQISTDHGAEPADASAIAISPDGTLIAAGDDAGLIHLWQQPAFGDPTQQQEITHWQATTTAVRSLLSTTIGERAAYFAGGEDGTLQRWELNPDPVRTALLGENLGPVTALAVSPDRKTLASGSEDGTISLWNTATAKLLRTIEKPSGLPDGYGLTAIGFSADGKQLAVAGTDAAALRIIHLESDAADTLLEGHIRQPSALARTSAATDPLYSAADDGSVLTWDPARVAGTAPQEQANNSHAEFDRRMRARDGAPLRALDVTPDGHWILTGGENGQVQLWNGKSGVLIGARFTGHNTKATVHAVAIAPDASYFVTAAPLKMLVWPGPDHWAELACRKLSSNMSRDNWRAWVSKDIRYVDQCLHLPSVAATN